MDYRKSAKKFDFWPETKFQNMLQNETKFQTFDITSNQTIPVDPHSKSINQVQLYNDTIIICWIQ